MEKVYTVITGTLGMDAHIIGTKMLSRALKEAGYNVIELGMQTPVDEFIKAAQETGADAILMSSLYGMAEFDLRGFKEKCLEAGLGNVLLYIGGLLGVTRHDFAEDVVKFKELGFDRVYPPPPEFDMKTALDDLRNDLKKRDELG